MPEKVDLGEAYAKVVGLLEELKIDAWDVISLMEYIKGQAMTQLIKASKKKKNL